MNPLFRAAHDAVIKRLADDGKLIEAGFMAMRVAIISPTAPAVQVSEMRLAYMAGAQHLFASMMSAMDPGSDPTPADLRRMSLIDAELRAFAREFELRVAQPGGSA